jgi:hypothetical protein
VTRITAAVSVDKEDQPFVVLNLNTGDEVASFIQEGRVPAQMKRVVRLP